MNSLAAAFEIVDTTKIREFHDAGIPILLLAGGALCLLVVLLLGLKKKTDAPDLGNVGIAGVVLIIFGLVQTVFGVLFIFVVGWQYGWGFAMAGLLAFGAGIGKSDAMASMAGWLNVLAFLQSLGTVVIVKNGTYVDDFNTGGAFDAATCYAYFTGKAENDDYEDRCGDDKYLQFLRIIAMLSISLQFVNFFCAFVVRDEIRKAQRPVAAV
eukprot:TRINITY_DN38760_c0_g1_i1.p2 TRINITY_DN38760_c0_g1~~TRINITY_DN38760_c0_g1_i1.p2  ORF type:complete len:220 (+),score=58.99 TRINITY_DN38760_c0_g1_i1:28-660(+)